MARRSRMRPVPGGARGVGSGARAGWGRGTGQVWGRCKVGAGQTGGRTWTAPQPPDPAARRKFWGWGVEGDGLAVGEIEHLGAAFAGRLGIDGLRVQEPPRVDEPELSDPPPAAPATPEAGRSADPADPPAHTSG